MEGKRGRIASRQRVASGFALVLGILFSLVAVSSADGPPTPPLLWQVPEDKQAGGSAGRLLDPEAVAVDQASGNVYVVEKNSARVSEFDPWGQFVRAWGWGVADGSNEFQICTLEAGCRTGIKGAGEGQFNRKIGGGGLAVAPGGYVYVGDPDNFRVEKFDSEGNFLLEFGEEGTGPGQLEPGSYSNNLAVGSDGTVYVGEKDRVQAFEPDGTFEKAIPFKGELEALEGKEFRDLAVDEGGNLYATLVGLEEIVKFNPAGERVAPGSFPLIKPRSLAIDDAGNLYTTQSFQEIVEFDKDANLLIPPGTGFGGVDLESGDLDLKPVGLAASSACGIDGSDLFALTTNGTTQAYVTAYGPPPDPALCPPPLKPPTIARQFTSLVSRDSAEVKAGINPHFWPDATYFVEYGIGRCSEGGCTSREPVGEVPLTEEVVDKTIINDGIALSGLRPGTEYHFRFVAESSGGGPAVGTERSFTTFADEVPVPPCSNDAFRTGPAAFLSDCRAYEMVSPVDKGGGEIFSLFNSLNERVSLNQGSLDGDRITYSSYRAFADPKSAPGTSQYLATRGGDGWSSGSISPPRGTPHQFSNPTLETQFRAFSGDLCEAWLVHDTDPPLAEGAPEDFPNLYKTNLCDEEDAYEALTVEPLLAKNPDGPGAYVVDMQGASADGTHTVFRAFGKLTTNAASNTNYQCYEHFEGKLRLVSVLPNGVPNLTDCSIGVAYSRESPHTAQLHNAISEDGSTIYWTGGGTPEVTQGRIYARVNRKNPTLAVSKEAETLSGTTATSNYWTASPDGSVAIFSTGNLLQGKADAYEYRLADKSTHLIAHKVRGYLGSSEDASVIYLASEEVLAGVNGEGNSPVAGKPNLYRYDASDESLRFVGVLSALDADSNGWSPLAKAVNRHTSRVSGDGRVAAFMSTEPLTGFDNTDAVSGKPDAEVFRYDASADGGEGELTCVSCNPTGVAPTGRELFLGSAGLSPLGIWAVAQIVPWEAQLAAPRVLPEAGERVLFESYEPLVARDTNGEQDVYEWSAPGAGSCTQQRPEFSPPNGGCLSLISSGESSLDAEFVDASADGRDVFFTTASSLVGQDPGLVDLYDARQGGGFPQPEEPVSPCQGETCQHPDPAPADVAPASQQPGEGNPKPPTTHRCPKGKVYSKKKKHCVKKHHKQKKYRAAKRRRAGVQAGASR
jgi:DNA-binding beta-propeller fold protein YncE